MQTPDGGGERETETERESSAERAAIRCRVLPRQTGRGRAQDPSETSRDPSPQPKLPDLPRCLPKLHGGVWAPFLRDDDDDEGEARERVEARVARGQIDVKSSEV
jgi:hypothetical protein